MLNNLFTNLIIKNKGIKAEGIVAKGIEIGPKKSFIKYRENIKTKKDPNEKHIWTLKYPREFKKTEYTFPKLLNKKITRNIDADK